MGLVEIRFWPIVGLIFVDSATFVRLFSLEMFTLD